MSRRSPFDPPPFIVGLYMITFICGVLDAACFLGLGHVFAEIMTGNLVYLAFAIGTKGSGAEASIIPYALVLGSFAAGALAGGRLLRLPHRWANRRSGFAAEWCILLGAVIATLTMHPTPSNGARFLVVDLLAAGMGVQNAMVWFWGVKDLATNVMTLTMTALIADSHLAGGANERAARRSSSIAVFASSALLGAFLVRFGVIWDLLIAFCVLTLALPILMSSGGNHVEHGMHGSPRTTLSADHAAATPSPVTPDGA